MNIASRTVFIGLTAGVLLAAFVALGLQPSFLKLKQTQDVRPNAVDIGFAQSMSQHHDQAILMSQLMLGREPNELTGVALAIQTAQLLQIGQMRGWLQLWNAPTLPRSNTMDWMLSGRAPPDAQLQAYLTQCRSTRGMPGIASSAELQRLREARGVERERQFLQLMIRHHLGALPMASFAAQNAETPVVRALAAQIVFDQGNEIQRLLQLLRLRGGKPLPNVSSGG